MSQIISYPTWAAFCQANTGDDCPADYFGGYSAIFLGTINVPILKRFLARCALQIFRLHNAPISAKDMRVRFTQAFGERLGNAHEMRAYLAQIPEYFGPIDTLSPYQFVAGVPSPIYGIHVEERFLQRGFADTRITVATKDNACQITIEDALK